MQYVSPCIVTISAPFCLTDCQRFFEQPATARQRQYEALRAYFLEEVPAAEAARSCGYSPGAFRVLCHAFRHGQLPDFFATGHAVRREQPRKSRAHEQIVALRKRNYSVYEISRALQEQGTPLSATAVREVLADEGFAPLPRRLGEQRPERARRRRRAEARPGDRQGPRDGLVCQPRLPPRPLLRRPPAGRIPLSIHAQPPPAEHPDLPGPGRREPSVLLFERRHPQGRGGRG